MGLSSNARLLSITARLTSNEYESQKISNAKTRLATQSQQASQDYINALNTQKLMFMTYDAQGNAVTTDLTASVLYQYGDSKSQYAISNAAGQLLIKSEDKEKFESASNLEEFLKSYGIEKTYKTEALANAKEAMDSYSSYKDDWEAILNEYRNKTYSGTFTNVDDDGKTITDSYSNCSSDDAWTYEKTGKYNDYVLAYNDYDNLLQKYMGATWIDTVEDGVTKTADQNKKEFEEKLEDAYLKQNTLWAEYTPYVTYDSWVEMKAKEENETEYNNYAKYLDKAAEFNAEVEKYDTVNETYSYSDTPKAQWYTNLWYRLNGESSEKSKFAQNNYALLEDNLLASSSWLQDALGQGSITIEAASYTKTSDQIPNIETPDIVNLRGISWDAKVYTSCSDITTESDETAITKAEAEYEAKTKDITAKEKKFESRMEKLETEHEALKTEYDSVKAALDDNIKRSYKTFNS